MIGPIICLCRTCGREYNEAKSSADWKGYCTQACFHAKAQSYGWRKSKTETRTEYEVLHRVNQIGSVFRNPPPAVIHVLRSGRPLCRFTGEVPMSWPRNHQWVSIARAEDATCTRCRDLIPSISGPGVLR